MRNIRQKTRKFVFSLALKIFNIPTNQVLTKKFQTNVSVAILKLFSLPLHSDYPKNWDSLAALSIVVKNVNINEPILDAGGEFYSAFLPQLSSLGFTQLNCINLTFKRKKYTNGITFDHGDITKTRFPQNNFSAIACLSVIEHGVNLLQFFKEMKRIIKPDGLLFISTDYWCDPINTRGQRAYGVPIKVFTSQEVRKLIEIAKKNNFTLLDKNIDLTCDNKVISWDEYDLDYTFIYMTFRKNL